METRISIATGELPPRSHNFGSAPIMTTRWQDLPEESEFFYYASVIDKGQNAITFTIHPLNSIKKIAEQYAGGPVQYISKRINNHLSYVDQCFFAIDISKNGSWHIHGMIASNICNTKRLKEAFLKIAGFRSTLPKKDRTYLLKYGVKYQKPDWRKKYKGHWGAYGWAQYTIKNMHKANKRLQSSHRPFYVSEAVVRDAIRFHKEDVHFDQFKDTNQRHPSSIIGLRENVAHFGTW